MESSNYLFCIWEIEEMILSHLQTPINFFRLMLINKYFYKIVNYNKIFLEMKDFYQKKDDLTIFTDCESYCQDFLKTCQYGYPYVAKYLFKKYMNKINIHIGNEYAFRYSCYGGHLEIAKWLYSLDHTINIHSNNEYAFRWSCLCGYFKIAKWLYSLDGKINIHAMNEYAFRHSCAYNHLETSKWLVSICDEYTFTVIDNRIVDYYFS